jgi:heat shock protein HslJ
MNKNTAISLIIVILIVAAGIFFISKGMKNKKLGDTTTTTDTINGQPVDENGNLIPQPGVTVPGVASIYDTDWSWMYTKMPTGEQIDAPAGNKFVLKFDQQTKRAYSSTDCNSLAAGFTADNKNLAFSALMATKMGCAGQTFEQKYASQLGQAVSYYLKADELHLVLKDGSEMVFLSVDSLSDK